MRRRGYYGKVSDVPRLGRKEGGGDEGSFREVWGGVSS